MLPRAVSRAKTVRLAPAEGVQSLFGVNTFVTITRKPGADWAVITAGVQKAAAELL